MQVLGFLDNISPWGFERLVCKQANNMWLAWFGRIMGNCHVFWLPVSFILAYTRFFDCSVCLWSLRFKVNLSLTLIPPIPVPSTDPCRYKISIWYVMRAFKPAALGRELAAEAFAQKYYITRCQQLGQSSKPPGPEAFTSWTLSLQEMICKKNQQP